MEIKTLLRQDFSQYVRPHFKKHICEVCGSDTEVLHVHHMTHFQELLDSTLEQLGLEYHEDIDDYTEEQLRLIRDVMISKQMRIKYITCCEPCHLELHDGNYFKKTKHNTTKNALKEQKQREQEQREQERKQKEQEIHNNIIKKLQVGMKYKYQQLCDAFGFKPATGNTKKKHMTTFEQYLKLEKQGTWFLVVEKYGEVQERNDGRKKLQQVVPN